MKFPFPQYFCNYFYNCCSYFSTVTFLFTLLMSFIDTKYLSSNLCTHNIWWAEEIALEVNCACISFLHFFNISIITKTHLYIFIIFITFDRIYAIYRSSIQMFSSIAFRQILFTVWKVSVFEVFLVRIFPHLDKRNYEYGHFSNSDCFAYSSVVNANQL